MPNANSCPPHLTYIGHIDNLVPGDQVVNIHRPGTSRRAPPMERAVLQAKLTSTWHRLQDIVSQVQRSGDPDRAAQGHQLLAQGRSLQEELQAQLDRLREDGEATVPSDEKLKRLRRLKRSAEALLPGYSCYSSRTTTTVSYVSRDGRPFECVHKGAAFSDSNGRFFAAQVFNEALRSPRTDPNPAPVTVEAPVVIRPRTPEAASTPCAAALPVTPDEEWTMLDLDPQAPLPPSAAPRRNAARRLLDRMSSGLRSMFAREHERGGDERRFDGLRMQRT